MIIHGILVHAIVNFIKNRELVSRYQNFGYQSECKEHPFDKLVLVFDDEVLNTIETKSIFDKKCNRYTHKCKYRCRYT